MADAPLSMLMDAVRAFGQQALDDEAAFQRRYGAARRAGLSQAAIDGLVRDRASQCRDRRDDLAQLVSVIEARIAALQARTV